MLESQLFPGSALGPNLLLLVALGLGLKYRDRLRTWLDRRFFREAYDRETLLRETLGDLKPLDSMEAVARLVAERLGAAVHPSCICILSRNRLNGFLYVLHSSSSAALQLVSALQRTTIGFGRPTPNAPFTMSALRLSDHDPARSALVVPIVNGDGQAVGLIILGEKRSDEPYTATDIGLLRGIADQIALVQERLSLREQLREAQRLQQDAPGHPSATELLWECVVCGRCTGGDAGRCPDDGGELTHLLPIEHVIARRYRVDRRVAAGGMGAVYEAFDLDLRRTVAIKVILATLFGDRRALERFQREAQAVAALDHPNIVKVYDAGRCSGDGAYLVMELVHGDSWRAVLNTCGTVQPTRLASWLEQLFDALEAVHGAGVIHRDLKPENVLIVREAAGGERITLVDFGLAAFEESGTHVQTFTRCNAVLGTPGYMSPEQVRGERCDWRTDLFSAAVMIIEALTGRHPCRMPSATPSGLTSTFELCWPDELTGTEELAGVLRRCIATDATDRYRSVRHMRTALLPALRACAVDPERRRLCGLPSPQEAVPA